VEGGINESTAMSDSNGDDPLDLVPKPKLR
jgi:hypothetical protein